MTIKLKQCHFKQFYCWVAVLGCISLSHMYVYDLINCQLSVYENQMQNEGTLQHIYL